MNLKDSGARRTFEGGAVRDIQEGKGRCDLMPLDVVGDCIDAEEIFQLGEFVKTGDEQYLVKAVELWIPKSGWDICTAFLEVSIHFEQGAEKYGEYNWQKGILTSSYIDSAVRHYLKWRKGETDEPHARAFLWNLICCAWTVRNKPEFLNYPVVPPETKQPEKPCPDCGVPVGALHSRGCDIETCPCCGGQMISCPCAPVMRQQRQYRIPWLGEPEAVTACRQFGWYARFVPNEGWVRCEKDHPEAIADLNRLHSEARWNPEAEQWEV